MHEAAETGGMAQRKSSKEIHQVVEQFRASGLSQMEYCRQTGMVLSTLGRYLRRMDRPEQQLVRVKMETPPPPEPGTGFVLMLGNGRRIASGWGFGDAELARLIHLAENA
jgi:hypothetical protein